MDRLLTDTLLGTPCNRGARAVGDWRRPLLQLLHLMPINNLWDCSLLLPNQRKHKVPRRSRWSTWRGRTDVWSNLAQYSSFFSEATNCLWSVWKKCTSIFIGKKQYLYPLADMDPSNANKWCCMINKHNSWPFRASFFLRYPSETHHWKIIAWNEITSEWLNFCWWGANLVMIPYGSRGGCS